MSPLPAATTCAIHHITRYSCAACPPCLPPPPVPYTILHDTLAQHVPPACRHHLCHTPYYTILLRSMSPLPAATTCAIPHITRYSCAACPPCLPPPPVPYPILHDTLAQHVPPAC